MKKSELLLPAGSLVKLKTALLYGADAVYAGTPDMSLRTQSKFSLEELKEGIRIVHEAGKKIYLTLNLYIHNEEARKLPQFVETLRQLKDMSCVPPVLYNALLENASVIMKAAGIDNITCSVEECYDYKPFDEDFFAEIITNFDELLPEERMIHEDISVLFTVDRGISHELVRHRDCSFAQESTRYCNYSLGKFSNEITVIKPCFWEEDTEIFNEWKMSCEEAEKSYFILINEKATAQQARIVLPTSLKAEIVMTANLREWKHIFNLRACDSTGAAHPQVKEVMIPCLKELRDNEYNFAFKGMIASDEVMK